MTTAQENYTAWLAAEIQAAIDDPRPSIPHAKVIRCAVKPRPSDLVA